MKGTKLGALMIGMVIAYAIGCLAFLYAIMLMVKWVFGL